MKQKVHASFALRLALRRVSCASSPLPQLVEAHCAKMKHTFSIPGVIFLFVSFIPKVVFIFFIFSFRLSCVHDQSRRKLHQGDFNFKFEPSSFRHTLRIENGKTHASHFASFREFYFIKFGLILFEFM